MPFSSPEPPVLISNQYVFSEMKPAFNLVKIFVQEVGSSNYVSTEPPFPTGDENGTRFPKWRGLGH